MSRLPLADPQDLPPFLKSMHDGAGADDWSTRHCARAFAAHPDILERYLAFYYPFHASDTGSVLDSRIKELVRLRIATLNGCKTCKAARLAPSDVSEQEAAVGVDDPPRRRSRRGSVPRSRSPSRWRSTITASTTRRCGRSGATSRRPRRWSCS